MTKTYRAILLVAVAIGAMGAAEPRRPTGRWVVDFDDAQCVASRNYGTAEKPLHLVLKAPPLGNVIQMGVIRSGEGQAVAKQLDAQVAIDGRAPLRTNLITFAVQKRRAFMFNFPIEEFAPAKNA